MWTGRAAVSAASPLAGDGASLRRPGPAGHQQLPQRDCTANHKYVQKFVTVCYYNLPGPSELRIK